MVKILSTNEEDYFKMISYFALFLLVTYVLLNGLNVIFKNYDSIGELKLLVGLLEILNPPFMMAFFTALYVLFTFLMLIQLKHQNKLLRDQVKNSLRPIISVRILPFGESGTLLEVRNIGNGNAYDVFISYKLKINEEVKSSKDWLIASLTPKESSKLVLSDQLSFKEFLKKFDSFKYNERYYSERGDCYKNGLGTEYNFKKMLEFGQVENVLIEKNMKEEINDLNKSVKEIKNSLIPNKNKRTGMNIKQYLKSLSRKKK